MIIIKMKCLRVAECSVIEMGVSGREGWDPSNVQYIDMGDSVKKVGKPVIKPFIMT